MQPVFCKECGTMLKGGICPCSIEEENKKTILDKKISNLINLGTLIDLKDHFYSGSSIPHENITRFISYITEIMDKTWKDVRDSEPKWRK